MVDLSFGKIGRMTHSIRDTPSFSTHPSKWMSLESNNNKWLQQRQNHLSQVRTKRNVEEEEQKACFFSGKISRK